jgi:thioredoxin-related protein
MKQKILCVVAIWLPLFVFCQYEKVGSAVNWSDGLTWTQLLHKAKKENKYIFVDCYATWCKPCKQMDAEVYTTDSVANLLNVGFISVKLQMDQTKHDDSEVRSWYKTANFFAKQYNLNAYPTMLFFTPSGELATKEVGYKDAGALILATRDAKDPSKQYYVLLKNYKKGKLDDAAKRSLIYMAKQLGDTANYYALRNSYFSYLHTLRQDQLYTMENIEFIATTISGSDQSLFDMFYPDGSIVNKVMQNDWYAKKVVDKIIFNEKVPAFLGSAQFEEIQGGSNVVPPQRPEPNWSILYSVLAKDYNGDYAERIVLETKKMWYLYYHKQLEFAKAMNDKMEKYGTDTTDRAEDFRLNNMAFILFKELGPTTVPGKEVITELARVTAWMEGVVRRGATATGRRLQQWPMYIDTYANLLHKIGRTAEAIKWEEFAIKKGEEVGDDKENIELYEDCLMNMNKKKPTWPTIEN